MGEDRGTDRVDTDGKVIGDVRHHIGLQLADAVTVIDDLVISDDEEGLDSLVLQTHPIGQGAEVVTDVETSGGTIPGENPPFLGMDGQIGLNLVTAGLRARQGGSVRSDFGDVAGHRKSFLAALLGDEAAAGQGGCHIVSAARSDATTRWHSQVQSSCRSL